MPGIRAAASGGTVAGAVPRPLPIRSCGPGGTCPIAIGTLDPTGAVVHATSCDTVAPGAGTVPTGSRVCITVTDPFGTVVVRCTATADHVSPAPPAITTCTCPVVAVDADLVATVYGS